MIVNYGHDFYQCNNALEFENIMRELLSKDSAEIWISQNGEQNEYPCMSVLVNESQATINHFGEDESCYASCNEAADDGFVSFCDGQYEIHSCYTISKEEALMVALDFYRDKRRSGSVKWDQLY